MSLAALFGGITRDLVTSCTRTASSEKSPRSACVVCIDNEARVACVPCGHMCLCDLDAPRVSACPVCRAPITHRLTVFD